MKVIKPPFSSLESVVGRRDVAQRQRPPHTASRPAVESDLSMRGVHQLYTAAEADRASRVEALRAQIKSGTYRPNLEIVAERLLADVGGGLG